MRLFGILWSSAYLGCLLTRSCHSSRVVSSEGTLIVSDLSPVSSALLAKYNTDTYNARHTHSWIRQNKLLRTVNENRPHVHAVRCKILQILVTPAK